MPGPINKISSPVASNTRSESTYRGIAIAIDPEILKAYTRALRGNGQRETSGADAARIAIEALVQVADGSLSFGDTIPVEGDAASNFPQITLRPYEAESTPNGSTAADGWIFEVENNTGSDHALCAVVPYTVLSKDGTRQVPLIAGRPDAAEYVTLESFN